MLNSHELRRDFVAAIEKSWDERAIWPGCKAGYVAGVSADCYGQCLVGTLNAWIVHGGPKNGYELVPGIAYGPGLPETGVWHFQLEKTKTDGSRVPVDVTWHQFKECTKFDQARLDKNPELFAQIMSGSLMMDASLIKRVGIISENLGHNGVRIEIAPHDIVATAQKYLLDSLLQARNAVVRDSAHASETSAEDWADIGDKLTNFTDTRGGPAYNPMSVTFRLAARETGNIVAHAVATFNQGEAELNLLFVEDGERKKRYGRELVKEFEELARNLGSISALIKTPTWQGEGYYESLGYDERLRLPIHADANEKPQFNVWYSKDLRPSLTSLSFEDSFFPALGLTDVTLRAEDINVAKGSFEFVAETSGKVLPVEVTGVVKAPFKLLPTEIFERDGKGGRASTLRDMRIFYPNMTENSVVTAISYRPASGQPSPL